MVTSDIIASIALIVSIINFFITLYVQKKRDLSNDLDKLLYARDDLNMGNKWEELSLEKCSIQFKQKLDKYLTVLERICQKYPYRIIKEDISEDLSFVITNKVIDIYIAGEPWSNIKRMINRMK